MSLEIPLQKEKNTLTPEIIKALEKGYEIEIDHLREKNLNYLNETDKIESLELRKDIVTRLGQISVEAANAYEELKKSLN